MFVLKNNFGVSLLLMLFLPVITDNTSWNGYLEKNFITGKGCGTKTAIKSALKVPEKEEDRPCTFVTDDDEFQRYIEDSAKPRWAPITDYGECSKSCGGGIKERLRECRKGSKVVELTECGSDSNIQRMNCYPFPCSTWSEWGDVECSSECGPGQGIQRRNCLNMDDGNSVTDPKHCHGKEKDTFREVPCVGMLCPGWQPWINLTECSKLCGIGYLNRTKECKSNSGDIVDPLTEPILCPGLPDEANVPCNEHDCPDPQQCHQHFPFALDDGKSCCRYDTRIDNTTLNATCDGGALLSTDPIECCREAELYTCPTAHLGGICTTRLDKDNFCQRDLNLTQHFGSTAFIWNDTTTLSYYNAEKICAADYQGTLLMLNEAGMTAAFLSSGASASHYWINLGQYASIHCQDSACEGVLTWGRQELPFTFDSSEQINVWFNDFNPSENAHCGRFQTADTLINDKKCTVDSNTYMACQTDCRMGTCPFDHPFAIEDGSFCCNSYLQMNNGSCDGTEITLTDSKDCCFDFVECESPAYGCIDNHLSNEFCPANPNLRRMGQDTGYLFASIDPMTFNEAFNFCHSNGANLVNIKTIEQTQEIMTILRHNRFPVGSSIWTGLMSPFAIGNISCTNEACDNEPLSWSDGSKVTFDDTVLESLTWSATVAHACSALTNIDIVNHNRPLESVDCFTTRHIALCQGSCLLVTTICPDTHPYAFDSGLHCCRSYIRSENCTEDGIIGYGDELDCCMHEAYTTCPGDANCENNANAKSKSHFVID